MTIFNSIRFGNDGAAARKLRPDYLQAVPPIKEDALEQAGSPLVETPASKTLTTDVLTTQMPEITTGTPVEMPLLEETPGASPRKTWLAKIKDKLPGKLGNKVSEKLPDQLTDKQKTWGKRLGTGALVLSLLGFGVNAQAGKNKAEDQLATATAQTQQQQDMLDLRLQSYQRQIETAQAQEAEAEAALQSSQNLVETLQTELDQSTSPAQRQALEDTIKELKLQNESLQAQLTAANKSITDLNNLVIELKQVTNKKDCGWVSIFCG